MTTGGPATRVVRPHAFRAPARIVAVGASVGGPDALSSLLRGLGPAFPAPIVIALHMPSHFTRELAVRLAAESGMRVEEAGPGSPVQGGTALLAPGGWHLTVVRGVQGARAEIHRGPPVHSCRPSADELFRSVAELYGAHALGVVLTGMGRDGLAGCRALRQAGSRILVQDAESSVVWGMPGQVAGAGLADAVLSLDHLPVAIAAWCGSLSVVPTTGTLRPGLRRRGGLADAGRDA